MQNLITKEVVFSYLAGQASPLQKAAIEAWRIEPAKEECFYQWVHEWKVQQPRYLADVSPALQRFQRISPASDETEDNLGRMWQT